MNHAAHSAIRRILRELQAQEVFEDVKAEMKNDELMSLQACNKPEDAMAVKYRLDAIDALFMKLSNLADTIPEDQD